MSNDQRDDQASSPELQTAAALDRLTREVERLSRESIRQTEFLRQMNRRSAWQAWESGRRV